MYNIHVNIERYFPAYNSLYHTQDQALKVSDCLSTQEVGSRYPGTPEKPTRVNSRNLAFLYLSNL